MQIAECRLLQTCHNVRVFPILHFFVSHPTLDPNGSARRGVISATRRRFVINSQFVLAHYYSATVFQRVTTPVIDKLYFCRRYYTTSRPRTEYILLSYRLRIRIRYRKTRLRNCRKIVRKFAFLRALPTRTMRNRMYADRINSRVFSHITCGNMSQHQLHVHAIRASTHS